MNVLRKNEYDTLLSVRDFMNVAAFFTDQVNDAKLSEQFRKAAKTYSQIAEEVKVSTAFAREKEVERQDLVETLHGCTQAFTKNAKIIRNVRGKTYDSKDTQGMLADIAKCSRSTYRLKQHGRDILKVNSQIFDLYGIKG